MDVISALTAVTDIGDSAVLTTLVIAVSAYLFAEGNRRDAGVFAGAYLAATALISIAKIVVFGCGGQLHQMGLHSPSGHTALSLTVLGLLGFVLRNRMTGKHRNLPLFILLPLAVFIAVSRVVLGFHTKEEVVAGLLIGGFVLGFASRLLTRQPVRRFNILALVLIILITGILMNGLRLPGENIIQLIAGHFRHLAHCTETTAAR